MSIIPRLIGVVAASIVIQPAIGSPPEIFKAGILQRDPHDLCDGLHVPAEQSWYLIDEFGTFSLGDTVVVTAAQVEACDCDGFQTYGCLRDNTIEAWRDLDLGCGIVLEDDEYHCKGFFSHKYGPFSLLGSTVFGQGDSVHVWGNPALDECMSIPECGFGYCLEPTRVVACADSGSAVQPISWGKLRSLYR